MTHSERELRIQYSVEIQFPTGTLQRKHNNTTVGSRVSRRANDDTIWHITHGQ